MEQHDAMGMLDLIVGPAFCVKDRVVVRINKAAEGRMIAVGRAIDPMIVTGQQEYADFTDGCLYLTLELSGLRQGASVTRMGDMDVFLLEQDIGQSELRAMSLAALHLREPLSNVMAVVNQLLPLVERVDDPSVKDQAAHLNRGLFQMLRILGNMSDANRYQRDTNTRQETREVSSYVGELFDKLAIMTQHAGVSLRFVNLQEPVYCLIHAEKLERAIYNILSNAVKFTPKGGTIDAKLVRRGNRLYLTVQDGGTGIPKEQPDIHFRFLREPGIDDNRHGIGLGMVIIRSAAAAHGGTVLVEQPEGAGMRLTMTMEIRQNKSNDVRSPIVRVDYAGEWDHSLIELSETLPYTLYGEGRGI